MLNYWRVVILATIVFGSILAIGMKAYPYGRNGVEIAYIAKDSPARGVLEQGMIITQLNDKQVKNVESWNKMISNISGNITLIANGKRYTLNVNESLGIYVVDIERTNIDFGLDLKGGTRILLKPKENATKDMIDQIISTLQTRANLYGLKEMHFYPVRGIDGNYYVQIEMAGVKGNVIEELLSTEGKFEAKVSKPVSITNGKGSIQLGSNFYDVTTLANGSVVVNNSVIDPREKFVLQNIEFEYINSTANEALFLAKVYEGDDIELVYTDPQRSAVVPASNGYRFYFAVLISHDGAKRFADVTSGVPSYIDLQTGERYLTSKIFLYLDGKLVSDLRISSDLSGKVVDTPQITGWRQTMEEAVEEKLRLQAILRSGALPTGLEIASISIISPVLGKDFFISTLHAALLAGCAVILLVFLRYRKLKIAIPMVLVGLSEIIIILGIAALNDYFIWTIILIINFIIISTAWWKKYEVDVYAWIGALLIPLLGLMGGWTIDLPAIGGILAAIGTGMDHMIIIADETLMKGRERKIYSIKESIKRAFFIIFGAAATTIAAMTPLLGGIGFLRGFAITTIVGVLVGVLVTRPAYGRIVESMSK